MFYMLTPTGREVDFCFAPNDGTIVRMKMMADKGDLDFNMGSESRRGLDAPKCT
jgi:hypothetical protein